MSASTATSSANEQPSLPLATWVDASVLLHDFMHRHPEVAAQRNVVPAQASALAAYRARVHAALTLLAESGAQVHTTTPILWRLAAVLGEWYLPPLLIKIEVQYLLSNYHIHEQPAEALDHLVSSMGSTPTLTVEEAAWQALGDSSGIKILLTCLPAEQDLWPGWSLVRPEAIATAASYPSST